MHLFSLGMVEFPLSRGYFQFGFAGATLTVSWAESVKGSREHPWKAPGGLFPKVEKMAPHWEVMSAPPRGSMAKEPKPWAPGLCLCSFHHSLCLWLRVGSGPS